MIEALGLLLRAVATVLLVIALVRINGLRSLAKLSSFGFVLTVATGSIIATTVMTAEKFWPGLGALVAVFATSYLLSRARTNWGVVERMIDNRPLLLMREGEILHENLSYARLTEADLIGKLREANALKLAEVRAVVLEPTGDVSVLHGDEMDDRLLDGVRRSP